MTQLPFWKTKQLDEMDQTEWESLCDGCGMCCLRTIETSQTHELFQTSVACSLFDEASCKCTDYSNRVAKVADCEVLTIEDVLTVRWLPITCGYRLVHEGKDLPSWHPLVSGSTETVHEAGISARGRVTIYDHQITRDEDLADHLLEGVVG
ncbi:hypothetical protein CQ054_22580 [Ochrobactrum sp. MYb29]|nr:hypothetical protein CQ054_22580 [Ochrobactrum sp. MYb29]